MLEHPIFAIIGYIIELKGVLYVSNSHGFEIYLNIN